MDHKHVQLIAKQTIEQIRTEVRAGMTLLQVRERCEKIMRELGQIRFGTTMWVRWSLLGMKQLCLFLAGIMKRQIGLWNRRIC